MLILKLDACAGVFRNLSRFTSTFVKSEVSNASSPASPLPFEAIPGPRRFPLLGPLNDLLTLGNPSKLHQTIDDLHGKFGSIFRLRINNVSSIFVSSPEYMRAIFLYEGKYPRHPMPPSWLHFNQKHNCERGLFFMEGEEWLSCRKILNSLMLRDFGGIHHRSIDLATDNFVRRLEREAVTGSGGGDGRDFEFVELEMRLYRWSIDVLLHAMLGHDCDIEGVVSDEFMNAFASVVREIFAWSSQLQTIPPKLAEVLRLRAWKEFERVSLETLRTGNEIVDRAVAAHRPSGGLLKELMDAGLSVEAIKRIFVDMILAAGDTTSFTVQFALYALATNPDVQQQFRESLSDPSASMSRSIVRETLRLYPIAPFIGRTLAQDGIVGGYKIPKDTLALLSLYSAGRSDTSFSDPHTFRPSRWERQEGRCDIFQPQASMPFSIGARSCIGRKIALSAVQSILTKLVQKYEIYPLNEEKVDVITRMVLVPDRDVRIGLKQI